PTDAARTRARAAARARARPGLGVVARAKAQQRRGALLQVRQHELARGAVVERDGLVGLGIDQLGVDEAARAEVHPGLLLALTPERDADVADAHRLGHLRAPARFELRPERRLAAAGLARNEQPLDARLRELGIPLGEVGRIRGRQHNGLRLQLLDRLNQPLAVAGPERD